MAKTMRKVRVGSVVRTRMDQTAVVEMVWKQRHPLYRKQVRRVARFYVHDPQNQCQLGDMVRIQETRPLSRTKHWRLLKILQRRLVADISPSEVAAELQEATTAETPVTEPEIADTSPAAELEEATTAETPVTEPEIADTSPAAELEETTTAESPVAEAEIDDTSPAAELEETTTAETPVDEAEIDDTSPAAELEETTTAESPVAETEVDDASPAGDQDTEK